VTNTKRPPLTADETTGLKVAGFHVVHEDELHERDYHLAAATARADKAESRVRTAGHVLASIAAEAAEVLADLRAGEVDQALGALTLVVERLEDEAEFFAKAAADAEVQQ
jgi:hypothetical protein